MIEEYKAGAWSQERVKLVMDQDTLGQLVPYLDLEEVYSAYIMLSDLDRIKLLSGDYSEVRIVDLHITKTKLWNSKKVYSQCKNASELNYKLIAYSAQVGDYKKWFNAPYLKKVDAATIKDKNFVFSDGNPRPFPIKLATVRLGTNFIITTHELLKPIIEGDTVETSIPEYLPSKPPENFDFWARVLFGSSPEAANRLFNQLVESYKIMKEYEDSMIRADRPFPEKATNSKQGLDRIQVLKDKTIGYIISTEIPVLIEQKGLDKNG